jgi:hypothetical protein
MDHVQFSRFFYMHARPLLWGDGIGVKYNEAMDDQGLVTLTAAKVSRGDRV